MGLQVRERCPKLGAKLDRPSHSVLPNKTPRIHVASKTLISPPTMWTIFHSPPNSRLVVDGPPDFFRHCKMSSMNLKTRTTVRAKERCSAKILQSAQVRGTDGWTAAKSLFTVQRCVAKLHQVLHLPNKVTELCLQILQ